MTVDRIRSFAGTRWGLVLSLTFLLAGCDHSPFDRTERGMDQAEQKQASRDYRGAINSYEQALDGTPKTAEAHFRMGIIYAEKLNDQGNLSPTEKRHNQVSAVHHFQRYIELTPKGAYVGEAQANLNRLELTLATDLAGGTLISHTEAVRLKTENADLRKQLFARVTPTPLGTGPSLAGVGGKPGTVPADVKLAPGSHTYQVQPGDTLASISRKFYKTKARAKDIQDANLNTVPNAAKLKTGQTLIIP